MKIDDKIKDEKLQYDIVILTENQQKHQQAILPSNQSRIIEQEKCAYSPLGKKFEK